jgi:hypothetical protein
MEIIILLVSCQQNLKLLNYSFYWHCLILIKCWNDNLHIIIRVNIYFIYLDCYIMSQSIIISNFISFDQHFKPYNSGRYPSVLILYVFYISKWHVFFLTMWTFLLFFFFTHCVNFAFCIYYMNFWHVLCPLGCGPVYLDWMNKKSKLASIVQQVDVRAQISQGTYVLVLRRECTWFKWCTTWYRQQRPSGRTTSAPAEPSTMCLPNTTLRHYHDTNLLLYFALFMGRDKNVGNKQNLVLYQKRGNGFMGLKWPGESSKYFTAKM